MLSRLADRRSLRVFVALTVLLVVTGPVGNRFIDVEVSRYGNVLGAIETKLGGSAYTVAQRAKDAWLGLNGYPVNVVREPR